MNTYVPYYVIAPIDGLKMNFDYRMYSAELYGCPPNYRPNPESCPEFRQPYDVLGKIPFHQYIRLVERELISDVATVDALTDLPDRKINDFTCIGFEIQFDETVKPFDNTAEPSQKLFDQIVERGESFLDPLRFCLFEPGKHESIGRFGSVGNGIQCFWIGYGTREDDENSGKIRFVARRSLRYTLSQSPIHLLETEFGPIFADITFQGLCHIAYEEPTNRDRFYDHMLRALKQFRESREFQVPEARFRHLVSIAEDLAKIGAKKRLVGDDLRNRIAKISSNGWKLYMAVNNNHPRILNMSKRSYELIEQRYAEIGWESQTAAQMIVKDLWSNVRNPLTHTLETFQTLGRDTTKDLMNLEKVIVTMVNGLYAAYEVEESYEKPAHEILLHRDFGDEADA